MSESVEKSLADLREQLTLGEARSRMFMTQYVRNRQLSYEALARVDPEAQFTRDAKERLEKAQRDLEEFEANITSMHNERSALLSPKSEPHVGTSDC